MENHVKKAMIAATATSHVNYRDRKSQITNMWLWEKGNDRHLKNLAGDTLNINESKINLDS